MFHTVCYNGDVGVNASDFDLPAVSDGVATISNAHFIFTWPAQIVAAYFLAASALRAKIQTPKLRALANPQIRPVERSATVPNRPLLCDFKDSPIQLAPIDETQALVSNNLGAATEREFVLLWASDGNFVYPRGPVTTIRATTVVVTVANVWSAAALVFDQVLPAGRYSVVGFQGFGTGILAARLLFPTQVFRPGALMVPSAGLFSGDQFRLGYYGEYGQFESVAQPTVEIMSIAAVTNPEFYLDLVKVR